MPLVQDDPDSDLNSFIDVAIKEDDNNPIVKASRSQNPPVRKTRPRQLSFNKSPTTWRSSRLNSSGKSVCSEPAARRKNNNTITPPRETGGKSVVSSAASVRGPFHTGEFQSIELETDEEDDDISIGSHGAVLFRPDKDFTINIGDGSSGRVGGDSHPQLGVAQANLKAEREAERVSMLEQQMAKLNFELAEARAAVDWHKLQHRHLHVEFEDLQAFCKQLQEDNEVLKSGIVPTRKKKGAWFKPERIRRLNQPRKRMDYQQQQQEATQTPQHLMDESSRSQPNPPSDGDWDDDTLTTNFGGAETSSLEKQNAMGSLPTSMDRRGSRGKRTVDSQGKPICGSPHTDDTPKAIMVTNQEISTEETVRKMVEMLEEDCNDFHNSTNDTTAQTELADYRNHIEEEMDDHDIDDIDVDATDNIDDFVGEIASNADVPEEKKGPRRSGLFSRFNQRSPNKSPKMKRTDEDGEQSVDTMKTAQTTKTMPALGWNLKGRRASFIEKHRFEPTRRTSATDNNLSNRGSHHSSNYAEMDDLSLHNSTHERKRAELDVEQDTTAKLKDDSQTNGNKPWWAKMQKNLPKLNKPFQNSQQNRQWRVDNNNDSKITPHLEDESEISEAWDQVGQELVPFERRSRSENSMSDEEMPYDLSGPAVPSSLHDYLPNYFDESNGRLDAAAYFRESQGMLDATAYFEDSPGRTLDANSARYMEVNSK